MFTGIIEELGRISAVRKIGSGMELDVHSSFTHEVNVDDSISINGVCQTVVKKVGPIFTVQAVEETLRKTTFGLLKNGESVNLERCLTLQHRIDGHIVQGHVDTTGVVKNVEKEGSNWLYTIAFDPKWKPYLVGRGSIAIDGISLTVARDLGDAFMVAIIPYTWENTTLKNRNQGDSVNLEFDILGKYVVKFLESGRNPSEGKLSASWLSEQGFD